MSVEFMMLEYYTYELENYVEDDIKLDFCCSL